MKTILIDLAKVATAGASLWLIALAVIALSPQKEAVQTAQADITEFVTRDALPDDSFSRLMKDVGIKGRPFDYNGNHVYFGAQSVRDTPRQGLSHLQQRFVERGINKEAHTESLAQSGMAMDLHGEKFLDLWNASRGEGHFERGPEASAKGKSAAEAYLSGEVMPITVSEDYISMSGIVPVRRGQEVSVERLHEQWETDERGALDPMINTKGFRFIDLTREKDRTTTMTATWADGDFDGRKLDPNYKGPGLSTDRDIPSCIGCKRTFRIEGLDQDSDPFTTNQFYSTLRGDSITSFYERSMRARGWKAAATQEPMSRLFQELPELQSLNGRMLFMERDGERVELLVREMEQGGTMVTSLHERSPVTLPDIHGSEAKKK